jgi:GNAT superfamily N-acetyltransferase
VSAPILSAPAYRAPTPADGPALSAMARRSFVETFAPVIDPAEMPVYLDTAYGPDGQMQRDLGDPAVDWRAAFIGDRPVGYIKVSAMTLPFDAAPGAMEVRQLYVDSRLHGAGVAETLMRWAIELAGTRGATELYLAVFDHNHRARRFYARHGFAKVGRFDFVTGGQVHDDGIWQKRL